MVERIDDRDGEHFTTMPVPLETSLEIKAKEKISEEKMFEAIGRAVVDLLGASRSKVWVAVPFPLPPRDPTLSDPKVQEVAQKVLLTEGENKPQVESELKIKEDPFYISEPIEEVKSLSLSEQEKQQIEKKIESYRQQIYILLQSIDQERRFLKNQEQIQILQTLIRSAPTEDLKAEISKRIAQMEEEIRRTEEKIQELQQTL